MLRSARRVSWCEDDAHDAVQAAAERFLGHRGTIDPTTVTGWLATVSRNEALRLRERRGRTTWIEDDDARLVHGADGPEELVARDDRVALASEALAGLKPHERQALLLQAEGRSYDEIASEQQWTRTKVNRLLTEGRANLRRGVEGIVAGEGCAAAAPRISRLAKRQASPEDLLALRPHLRRCGSCRARLRRARGGRWSLLPPFLLPTVLRFERATTATPPVRTRTAELVALVLPTGGAASEAGLLAATGLAAVVLGVGVAVGGAGDEPPTSSSPPTRTAAASRATLVPPPSAALAAVGPLGTALVPARSDETADARRAARLEQRRAERRRAARRRDERRRAERRRANAAARRAAAQRSATESHTPPASSPSTTPGGGSGPSTSDGGGSGSPSGGQAPSPTPRAPAPAGGGSADAEFGIE